MVIQNKEKKIFRKKNIVRLVQIKLEVIEKEKKKSFKRLSKYIGSYYL